MKRSTHRLRSSVRHRRQLRLEPLEGRHLLTALSPTSGDYPFDSAEATYLGTVLWDNTPGNRAGLYDQQPSIMHDPADASAPYKMWWLGEHPTEVPGDRIYYSHASSPDGPWSAPTAVLAPQFGQTGQDEADDHLLGSPTVVRIDGTYYMYYEAYGMYATAIQSFYSFDKGDNWTYNGYPQPELDPTYAHQGALGIAPRYAKADAHPIYAGEVTFAAGTPSEKISRFLRRTPISEGADGAGNTLRALNGNEPIFYLYDGPGEGRKPLYNFYDPVNRNNYVSDDPTGGGVPGVLVDTDFELGYAAVDLSAPDMAYSLQNRVMMATSDDGMSWIRFDGEGSGNSIVEPREAFESYFDMPSGTAGPYRPTDVNSREYWDISRVYGSGFPSALVRDNTLELFFTDTSPQPGEDPEAFPRGTLRQFRIRVPLPQIASGAAYETFDDPDPDIGNRDGAFYGEDIAWSPLTGRYYFIGFDDPGVDPVMDPLLNWSSYTTNPSDEHFAVAGGKIAAHGFNEELPTEFSGSAERRATRGGILTNELGQTLDFPDAQSPYSAFHLYYEATAATSPPDFYQVLDFDHILVLATHSSPDISISDASVSEGDAGQKTMTFDVTLNQTPTQVVTVDYQTSGDSATSGIDYAPRSGTLTFDPAATGTLPNTQQISVPIYGDSLDEISEQFFVTLSNAQHAQIVDGSSIGTIIDDDPPVLVSLSNNPSVSEGDTGISGMDFTVSLSAVSGRNIRAYLNVYDNGATLGEDYSLPAAGFVDIPAGETSATYSVQILGDTTFESHESLRVEIDRIPSGRGAIDPTIATGTILNDDPLPPPDYSGNGVVDAADYTIWRDHRDQSVPPFTGGDGNGDGEVDIDDYLLWASRYGETSPPAMATAMSAFSSSLDEPFEEEPDATPRVSLGLSPVDSAFAWYSKRDGLQRSAEVRTKTPSSVRSEDPRSELSLLMVESHNRVVSNNRTVSLERFADPPDRTAAEEVPEPDASESLRPGIRAGVSRETTWWR